MIVDLWLVHLLANKIEASFWNLMKVKILYLHAPDHETPLLETLTAINDLYKEGKFEEFGLSNFSSWVSTLTTYINPSAKKQALWVQFWFSWLVRLSMSAKQIISFFRPSTKECILQSPVKSNSNYYHVWNITVFGFMHIHHLVAVFSPANINSTWNLKTPLNMEDSTCPKRNVVVLIR